MEALGKGAVSYQRGTPVRMLVAETRNPKKVGAVRQVALLSPPVSLSLSFPLPLSSPLFLSPSLSLSLFLSLSVPLWLSRQDPKGPFRRGGKCRFLDIGAILTICGCGPGIRSLVCLRVSGSDSNLEFWIPTSRPGIRSLICRRVVLRVGSKSETRKQV